MRPAGRVLFPARRLKFPVPKSLDFNEKSAPIISGGKAPAKPVPRFRNRNVKSGPLGSMHSNVFIRMVPDEAMYIPV
jgi:hypothetical protein